MQSCRDRDGAEAAGEFLEYTMNPVSGRLADEVCEREDRRVVPPRLRYPGVYSRRGVEGWALLSYDVAPWGEIGNIEAVQAEPTEDFGKEATTILRRAKLKPVKHGATSCTVVVRFKMGERGRSDEVVTFY